MLAIRLISIDDDLRRLVEEGPDGFARVYGATLGESRATVREVVQQTLALLVKAPRAPEWGGFLGVDRARAMVIGTCGFTHGPEVDGTVEIAYFTFPEFEGRGYATAMARELVNRASQSAIVREVVAHTLPERNASTRILEKVGLYLVGEAHDPEVGKVWRWAHPPSPAHDHQKQGTKANLTHRLARREDLGAMRILMDAAISELQKPFLDEGQIASSRVIMGLDTQLVEDGTYFIVEADGKIAGCGGFSRRATLYGGDQTPGRSAALLDPAQDAARIRAMYTHPDHTRKGVGRLILSLCEEAARSEGFKKVELMSTLAGEPLYRACGYEPGERVMDHRGGAAVALLRMRKSL